MVHDWRRDCQWRWKLQALRAGVYPETGDCDPEYNEWADELIVCAHDLWLVECFYCNVTMQCHVVWLNDACPAQFGFNL